MFSRLLVFLIVFFNCTTLDAQTVFVSPNDHYNWYYKNTRGICTCVKLSVKSNIKSNYYNCFKLQEGGVFKGYRLIDEYYPSGQNKSSFLIRSLFATCPGFIEAYNKFVLYPINFKESDLRRVLKKKKFKKWTKKNIAFYGVIFNIKETEDKRYYKIKIGNEFIWMHYPISNDRLLANIGAKIKAIGTMSFVDPSEIDFLDNSECYISIFGFIDLDKENVFYDPAYKKELEEWYNRKIPNFKN